MTAPHLPDHANADNPATVSADTQLHVTTPPHPDLPPGWLAVDALDMDAQGIARRPDGKVVFIDGALPFEWVSVQVHRQKNNWEAGTVTAVHRESSQRVRPGCPHFGLHAGACGGCKMQHLHESAQGLPSFLAMCPLRKTSEPVCTNGT